MTDEILYDVIVVGGGPSGTSAASFLGMKGKKVLLLDKEKWPRDKTCGDALSGKSIEILKELGLTSQLEKADHGIVTGLTFSSANSVVVKIPFAASAEDISKGYVARRMVSDFIMWQNAKKHADAQEGMNVVGVVKEGEKIVGVKARDSSGKEHEFRAKLVIGADGASSLIAREVRGADIDPNHTCVAYRAYYSGVKGMDGTLEIHFVKSIMPGYFWIFPLENGLANVGVGMLMSDMKKNNVNLQKAMLDAIEQNPLFKERFAGSKLVSPIKAWSLPFGSKKRKVHADNVMLVGDAAGLVDPFSGEGQGNALLSGKFAAQAAIEALEADDTSEKFLARYDERLWNAVWNELQTSYNMQKLGRNEWLLNFVVGKAAKSAKAREAIAGTFTSKEARGEYQSPLFYLKLLFA
ncbi:Digeranylgeranylglycerophospholipid reductase [uncultured archaeon]|nr:Digeranylgeranylglycerophospholipid reductase [uncultured archaeon]